MPDQSAGKCEEKWLSLHGCAERQEAEARMDSLCSHPWTPRTAESWRPFYQHSSLHTIMEPYTFLLLVSPRRVHDSHMRDLYPAGS